MDQGKGGSRNRRAYERFAVDLKVRVHDADAGGQRELEDSVLRDVSGGGVSFLSRNPGQYHTGQRLRLVIILPGTDKLDACMEGIATVAWVGKADDTGAGFIGVSMDDTLDFRRSAVPPDGNEGGA